MNGNRAMNWDYPPSITRRMTIFRSPDHTVRTMWVDSVELTDEFQFVEFMTQPKSEADLMIIMDGLTDLFGLRYLNNNRKQFELVNPTTYKMVVSVPDKKTETLLFSVRQVDGRHRLIIESDAHYMRWMNIDPVIPPQPKPRVVPSQVQKKKKKGMCSIS